jgi:hypothetical protein
MTPVSTPIIPHNVAGEEQKVKSSAQAVSETPSPETATGRVSVPSNPAIPLTREQLDSVFGGVHRMDAARDLIAMLRQGRGCDVA